MLGRAEGMEGFIPLIPGSRRHDTLDQNQKPISNNASLEQIPTIDLLAWRDFLFVADLNSLFSFSSNNHFFFVFSSPVAERTPVGFLIAALARAVFVLLLRRALSLLGSDTGAGSLVVFPAYIRRSPMV